MRFWLVSGNGPSRPEEPLTVGCGDDSRALAVINTRVLVRGAANVLRRGEVVPDSLKEAVFDLARAVRALATYLEESEDPEPAAARSRRRAGRPRLSRAPKISPRPYS